MENTSIIARLRLQRLPVLCHRRFSASKLGSMGHVIDEPVEEELLPGEILDDRFKTITKLGYGAGSTVWLAENIEFKKWKKSSVPRYVSIKIAALDTDMAWETRISKLIANAEPSHEGLAFIRMPVDEFPLRTREGASRL